MLFVEILARIILLKSYAYLYVVNVTYTPKIKTHNFGTTIKHLYLNKKVYSNRN